MTPDGQSSKVDRDRDYGYRKKRSLSYDCYQMPQDVSTSIIYIIELVISSGKLEKSQIQYF